MGLPLEKTCANQLVRTYSWCLHSKNAIIIGSSLIHVIPFWELHEDLTWTWTNTTIHASGNIGVVFLNDGTFVYDIKIFATIVKNIDI